MRAKKEIDISAATFPERYGSEIANRLGFSSEESYLLWWLARRPDHVLKKFDENRKTKLLKAISEKPSEAAKLIQDIRLHENRKRDNVIRRVLLDRTIKPPIRTQSDKEVADLICKKINQKLKGEALLRLIELIKKTRQTLAKTFPAAKGKI